MDAARPAVLRHYCWNNRQLFNLIDSNSGHAVFSSRDASSVQQHAETHGYKIITLEVVLMEEK